MEDQQFERLLRALEEIGFNGALTRERDNPAMGGLEALVHEARKMTVQLTLIQRDLRHIAESLQEKGAPIEA